MTLLCPGFLAKLVIVVTSHSLTSSNFPIKEGADAIVVTFPLFLSVGANTTLVSLGAEPAFAYWQKLAVNLIGPVAGQLWALSFK